MHVSLQYHYIKKVFRHTDEIIVSDLRILPVVVLDITALQFRGQNYR